MRGERGQRALFVLPAVLFTVAMVDLPDPLRLLHRFADWNLSSFDGPHFNGLDNLVDLFHDAYFWNALLNMVYYVAVGARASTPSPSAWRFCSMPRSGRASSSASPSCCRSC